MADNKSKVEKDQPKVDMTPQDNARDADAMVAAKTDGPVKKAEGPASESSDPVVQRLLAVRQAALMNEDEEALKNVDDELVDLGYTEFRSK